MQFNTFFCRQGVDSSVRFALINLAAFFAVLIFYVLLNGHVSLLLVGLAAAVFAGLSAKRRLQGRPIIWAFLPAPGLILLSLGLINETNTIVIGCGVLLGLAACVFAVLQAPPKSQFRASSYGYRGPLSPANRRVRRVEPVIADDGRDAVMPLELDDDPNESPYRFQGHQANDQQAYEPADGSSDHNASTHNREALASIIKVIGQGALRAIEVIKARPRASLLGAGSLMLVSALVLMWSDEPIATQSAQQENTEASGSTNQTASYQEAIMPDGFSILLDEDVLMISWLGERGEPGLLWSLATGQGDRSCQELTFNNGAQYRPMEVSLLPDSSTLARFSPLDTRAILNDVAMRGSLKLCGYQFSLKGSQAALAKQAAFRPYL